MEATTPKELIEWAMRETGLNVTDLADRLAIKERTLKRIRSGEVPLTPQRRAHIQSLVDSFHRNGALPLSGNIGSKSKILEDPPDYVSNPREFLRKRREQLSMSVDDLARKAGVSADCIRKIEAGEYRGTSEAKLRSLAKSLELPETVFLSGSDEPVSRGFGTVTFGATPDIEMLDDNLVAVTIPLISWAQAGTLSSYEDAYTSEAETIVEVPTRNALDRDRIAITVRGDSMEPDYRDGIVAICYPHRPWRDGNLVVAKKRNGDVMFKRIQRVREDRVRLLSRNPIYQPVEEDTNAFDWIYKVGKTVREED